MGLNGLAKKAKLYDGQVEVAFLPYLTLHVRLLWRAMEAATSDEEWDTDCKAYITAMGTLQSVTKLRDDLDYRALGLLHFWQHKTGNAVEDYGLFKEVVPLDALDDFYGSYNETRVHLPLADAVLHQGIPDEDTDPEPSSAGKKRSRSKSSR